MNAYCEDLSFEVPKVNHGWRQVINTADADAAPADPQAWNGATQAMKSRSLVLLVEHSCF
jgi:hypothetical protein